MKDKAQGKTMKKYRYLIVLVMDVVILAFSDWVALAFRYDFSYTSIPNWALDTTAHYLPIQIVVTVAIFWLLRMYQFLWRSVTARDVAHMFVSTIIAFLVNLGLQLVLVSPGLHLALFPRRLPYSVYCIMLMLQLMLFAGMRSVFRFTSLIPALSRESDVDKLMIVGAGTAGKILVREFLADRFTEGRPCCFIDDNRLKRGKYLNGIPIVGGRDKIPEAVEKYGITKIVYAIPSAKPEDRRELLSICAATGCKVLTMPALEDMLDPDRPRVENLQALRIEDLLGREPVQLDTQAIDAFIRDKTILVTGGGGSIGSELCRQIAAYHPKKLIILDIYENNAYDIQQELRRTWGKDLDMAVEIASVRDKAKTYHIFEKYLPDVVFHAAAHKHVPLMEINPEEAVKNNIFGTYHVVRAAEKYGVKKFVMISTDKAVNPTNVMGASKRFCEMILQSRRNSLTEFCSVRFGNVLGSNGSVVPLFEKQIAAGGPVTITDKRITRFFMTIPEAVQLVMEAAAIASRNQIFVLDMGKPVTILSLAENMIRLHGLKPYQDIDIVEIGLRPGEKLYEELLMESQHLTKMRNSKIFVEEQEDISQDTIMQDLRKLDQAVTEGWDEARITELMHELVPTFKTPEEVNAAAAAKA